jgi:TonB-dependent SusC/RagA subfamily outer membrane receptor
VLKDGTSIYGSKAANGVILIKTKRSSTQVTKIGLNITTGFSLQPKSLPMMKGEDYRVYATDLLGTTGYDGRLLSSQEYLVTDPSSSLYPVYHNNTDWNDEVYHTGWNQHYMINAMGGDEKAMYYFSVGLSNNQGVIRNSDQMRINTRFNADVKLLSQMDLALNIGFTRSERNMQDDGIDDYTSPTWLAKIKSPFISPHTFTDNGEIMKGYDDADIFGIGNPSAIIRNSRNAIRQFRFNIGLKPEYRFSQNLSLSTQFDYNIFQANERRFVPMIGTATRYLEAEKGYSDNELNSQAIRNRSVFDDTQLKYVFKLDQFHHLKALYGWRFQNTSFESDYMEGHNSGSDNNTTITTSLDYLKVDGVNNHTKSLSNYWQADYNYDQRYFAIAAMSMDASSRFGKNTQGGISLLGTSWGLFPSLQLGWLISSESFMRGLPVFDLLKLRTGVGVTGNDDVKDYTATTYFKYVQLMDKANGLILANLANDALPWETTTRLNTGLDMALFNARMSLSVDL